MEEKKQSKKQIINYIILNKN